LTCSMHMRGVPSGSPPYSSNCFVQGSSAETKEREGKNRKGGRNTGGADHVHKRLHRKQRASPASIVYRLQGEGTGAGPKGKRGHFGCAIHAPAECISLLLVHRPGDSQEGRRQIGDGNNTRAGGEPKKDLGRSGGERIHPTSTDLIRKTCQKGSGQGKSIGAESALMDGSGAQDNISSQKKKSCASWVGTWRDLARRYSLDSRTSGWEKKGKIVKKKEGGKR